jgi:hypothetical protein
MKHGVLVGLTAVAGILLMATYASPLWAGDPHASSDPLAPFERLVGGQWYLDEGSHQEFEWGVGRQSVKARSYFVIDGERRLVSEGTWYWHQGEKQIKGALTAIEMRACREFCV